MSCQPCDSNCLKCSSAGSCELCLDGFYPLNDICRPKCRDFNETSDQICVINQYNQSITINLNDHAVILDLEKHNYLSKMQYCSGPIFLCSFIIRVICYNVISLMDKKGITAFKLFPQWLVVE